MSKQTHRWLDYLCINSWQETPSAPSLPIIPPLKWPNNFILMYLAQLYHSLSAGIYSGAKLYNDLPNSLKSCGQLLPFSRLYVCNLRLDNVHSSWHWFPINSSSFTFHLFLLWSPQWLGRVMLRFSLSASPHVNDRGLFRWTCGVSNMPCNIIHA